MESNKQKGIGFGGTTILEVRVSFQPLTAKVKPYVRLYS